MTTTLATPTDTAARERLDVPPHLTDCQRVERRRLRPETHGRPALDRADRITAMNRWVRTGYRIRSRLLCLAGRHLWARRLNPGVGGPRAVYHQCRRCGHERSRYSPMSDLFAR